MKHARPGIAAALVFASMAAGATLLLNSRFVDDSALGITVFLLVPIVGGGLLGAILGSALERLARAGSSEDHPRAYRLLWAWVAAIFTALSALAVLPPFLGLLSSSETIRYGGALVLAAAFGAIAGWTTHEVALRWRPWIWPLLLALPAAAILSGASGAGRSPSSGAKVLLLAFPGMSWSVAEDLIEKGEMPNLARLRRSGSWGDAHTVKPLLPPVVWTSIATGKTSEEHGVMSFSATSNEVRVKRIWDIYASRGWSVGLFGWPVTWPPPENVDGFVVPAISDLGTDATPPELGFIRELAMNEKTNRPRAWGRYWRYAFLGIKYGAQLGTVIESGKALVFDDRGGDQIRAVDLFRKRVLRSRLSCDHFVDLRRRTNPEFAAFHTNIIDVAQAHFWKYYEPSKFENTSPEDIERYGSSVHDAYRHVDGSIGRILAATGPNDLVVVVSDHGAEAISEAAAKTYTLRLEPLLESMRLKNVVEATNVGARTYVRMKSGHEGDLNRVRRLFETARLGDANERAFATRVDEWENLVVTVEPITNERPHDTVLFQGGRCRVSDVVRAIEIQESSQMKETGAIVLAGKGVVPGGRIAGASLLDLVPTLLALSDFDLAADMPGDVIEAALTEPFAHQLPGFVASYEPSSPMIPAPPAGGDGLPSPEPAEDVPFGG